MCLRAAASIPRKLRDQLSWMRLDEMLRAIRNRIDSCQSKVRLKDDSINNTHHNEWLIVGYLSTGVIRNSNEAKEIIIALIGFISN